MAKKVALGRKNKHLQLFEKTGFRAALSGDAGDPARCESLANVRVEFRP
jgi:hypothetical protein